MKRTIFHSFIFLLLIVPVAVGAETVLRTGQSVSIANDKGVVGDFYGFGNTVSVSGVIEGDFISAAGGLTLNGEVAKDILAIAGSVDIHGPVGDDVRIVAGEAIIADKVTGDVVVVAGNLQILSTAAVEGDVLVYGGSVEIAAPVGGSVLGNVGELRIDSAVEGSVDVEVGQITLGDNAQITGAIAYRSENIIQRSPNAVVEGEILRNDSVIGAEEEGSSYRTVALLILLFMFSALVWFLISRKSLHVTAETAILYSPKPLLFGLAVLFLGPVVGVVLATSMVGALVAAFVFVVYLLFMLMAVVATPVTIGLLALKVLNQSTSRLTLLTIVLGVLAAGLVMIVPVVGPLLVGLTFVAVLGSIALQTLEIYKK